MALRLREVCDLILYELYWLSADPSADEDIAPGDLYVYIGDHISTRFFDAAIDRLGSERYIKKAGVLPDTMVITDEGLSYVDKCLDDPNTFVWEEHQRRPPGSGTAIPAAGRYVDLDHNSQEHDDAIGAGQNLIDAVRSSNTYADTNELDKDRRVAELEAGYRLLNARRVNPSTIKAVLGGVLAYLATKFANEPIGDLARVAWDTLKNLFGFR